MGRDQSLYGGIVTLKHVITSCSLSSTHSCEEKSAVTQPIFSPPSLENFLEQQLTKKSPALCAELHLDGAQTAQNKSQQN